MDPEEILRRAWAAVEKSGVPEALHEVAFKEAVALVDTTSAQAEPHKKRQSLRPEGSRQTRDDSRAEADATEVPDEDSFFSDLADESGADENDLRDILELTEDGKVHVLTPTKNLGRTAAQQARTVVALVAGARSKGLHENPVSGDAVRAEVMRKHCYQQNNFAHAHVAPMKGFNIGSNPRQMSVTSKWVAEFKAAVDVAHGRKPNPNDH